MNAIQAIVTFALGLLIGLVTAVHPGAGYPVTDVRNGLAILQMYDSLEFTCFCPNPTPSVSIPSVMTISASTTVTSKLTPPAVVVHSDTTGGTSIMTSTDSTPTASNTDAHTMTPVTSDGYPTTTTAVNKGGAEFDMMVDALLLIAGIALVWFVFWMDGHAPNLF